MNGWNKKKFIRENTLKGEVPNKPGIYKFHDKYGNLLYTGHASKLRHRIQSYRQKDDYNAHRTKDMLRGRIASFSYKKMPVTEARKREKTIKKNGRFNFKWGDIYVQTKWETIETTERIF